jgi:hypothetical protein
MSPSRIRRNQRRERRALALARLRPKFSADILAAWDHALWVLRQFCAIFHTPRDLSLREMVATWEHRELTGWIRALELLTRRIILAAALAMTVVLGARAPREARPRKRRIRLVWPQKPETWIARFRMVPPTRPEVSWIYRNKREVPRTMPSFPLARRLEAVRRALANPEARARRFAIKLARIAARNAKANEPRRLYVRSWISARARTGGERMISPAMANLTPLIEDQLDRWNEACEPG